MIIAETSFAQAALKFKEFLAENNLPTKILWVFTEDTFSRNNGLYETHFWIKLPLPKENKKIAEKYYKDAQQKRLGICISAFALCENSVCCSLVIPKDEQDSEYLFLSPEFLKFTFLKDLPKAQPVKSLIQWKLFNLLSFKFRKGCFMDYVQSRKVL